MTRLLNYAPARTFAISVTQAYCTCGGKNLVKLLHREAPSKINLGLHVLRVREDGFHDIETVMIRIGWSDAVSLQPADRTMMTCTDSTLPADNRNTCLVAVRTMADRYGVEAGVQIHLTKNVPYGAGLGSGSSDAASTIRLLDDLWNLGASDDELHEVAAKIGSDVPFFLGGPVQFAEGRGDLLQPVTCLNEPGGFPFSVTVVVPRVRVSTAKAYQIVVARERTGPGILETVCTKDLGHWREALSNDFEVPMVALHPEIGRIRDRLIELGAGYASLSGSGSAVFGVFESAEHASEAARPTHWVAGTRTWSGTMSC